jgi:hypothetical protein
MTVQCIKCKEAIPEGRLKALPGATTCVSCSSSKMKRSITVTKGEGEDTYNDIVIMEADQYNEFFGKKNQLTSNFRDDELIYNDQD